MSFWGPAYFQVLCSFKEGKPEKVQYQGSTCLTLELFILFAHARSNQRYKKKALSNLKTTSNLIFSWINSGIEQKCWQFEPGRFDSLPVYPTILQILPKRKRTLDFNSRLRMQEYLNYSFLSTKKCRNGNRNVTNLLFKRSWWHGFNQGGNQP